MQTETYMFTGEFLHTNDKYQWVTPRLAGPVICITQSHMKWSADKPHTVSARMHSRPHMHTHWSLYAFCIHVEMHCTVSFLQSLSNREVNTHTLPQNGLQGYGLQYGHLLTASVVLNTLSVLQSLSNREVNTHTLLQNGLQGYGLQYGHLLTASVVLNTLSVLQSLSNREVNTHTLPQNGLQGYGLQYGHLLTASVYGRRELCCFEHASE